MFPSFFDLTLKTWDSLTNHPRPNPIFLFKHLTQRVYADSISADTAPPGGRNQLIKIETLNAKGFRYSHPTVTKLVSFDCKFYPFSTPGFFSLVPVTVLSELTVWSRLSTYVFLNLFFLVLMVFPEVKNCFKFKIYFWLAWVNLSQWYHSLNKGLQQRLTNRMQLENRSTWTTTIFPKNTQRCIRKVNSW